MGRYFQKTFRPDIINGDVSVVIGNQVPDATDAPFTNQDLLFDWQAIDIPLGTNAIVDGLVHMYGEDGGGQTLADFFLLIAKSNNGSAPTTLGNVNSSLTSSECFELPDVLMGVMSFEGTSTRAGAFQLSGPAGTLYHFNTTTSGGQTAPVVIHPEYNALGSRVTNRIYVAGIAGGAFDFSTGVKPTGQVAISSGTIAVDGTDPRKVFRVGDIVYTNTENTPCGTIASMTASQIVLNANTAVQIEDNEELVNAKPITVTLGFQGK